LAWRASSANGVHQAEAHAPGGRDRACCGAGQEHRRVRLLQRVREQLIGAIDLEMEMAAMMGGAFFRQQLHEQRQRFLLDVAPVLERDAEAVELVFAVAGTEPEGEAAAAQYVDEGRVLGDPQRIGERQGHHRGADLDAPGQRREIARIDEHIRHDAVFAAEMVLGEPGAIVAELVGAQDFARHPGVDGAMRVGLGVGIGVGGEQDTEFHA
jgi:hypothetical protein